MDNRILFLCTGNYYRSRFAELFFNHLVAAGNNLAWRADSAGLRVRPGSNIGPLSIFTREALVARGIAFDDPPRFPRQAAPEDFLGHKIIIALKEAEHRPLMQTLHPAHEDKIRYWLVHDLNAASPGEALAHLESHIHALVHELTK